MPLHRTPHKPAAIRAVALILSLDGQRRPACLSSAAAAAQEPPQHPGCRRRPEYPQIALEWTRHSAALFLFKSSQVSPRNTGHGFQPNTGDPLPARLTWTYFSVRRSASPSQIPEIRRSRNLAAEPPVVVSITRSGLQQSRPR
jgi:hypothetical protein